MARHLIVGAGASFAECQAATLPERLCLPLMNNFARKLWDDYNPAPLLLAYLGSENIEIPKNGDAREIFFDLERSRPSQINVERFFEFAWHNEEFFPGEWENLIYHGILSPMIFILSQGLWKNGIENCKLQLTPKVATRLNSRDIVVNLNYDTLFEIGLNQAGKHLTFSPNKPTRDSILIAKPHGSINMIINKSLSAFAFGDLNWPGSPQPSDGSANYIGFVPPRLNKNFKDHPISTEILRPIRENAPSTVTFWGIGCTNSDVDLDSIFEQWCRAAKQIEIVNPDGAIFLEFTKRYGMKTRHFDNVQAWLDASSV